MEIKFLFDHDLSVRSFYYYFLIRLITADAADNRRLLIFSLLLLLLSALFPDFSFSSVSVNKDAFSGS